VDDLEELRQLLDLVDQNAFEPRTAFDAFAQAFGLSLKIAQSGGVEEVGA
jgi:hypothetical protein